MRRIAKVLVATALMVVLMATAVSPAFAVVPEKYGTEKKPNETGIGYGQGKCGAGTPCGHGAEDSPYHDDPPFK
jgi:hypothetical protein